MLQLSQNQIDYIDNFIVEYYNGLSDEENEKTEGREDSDSLILKIRLKNFKRLKTPEELHYLALKWNWDEGLIILTKILEHPLCDKGTALLIYWLSDPDYYYSLGEKKSSSYEGRKLTEAVEKKLLSDEFKSGKIKFNPKSVASWESIDNSMIPESLKIATSGEEFDYV